MSNKAIRKKLETEKVSLCNNFWAILVFIVAIILISFYLYLEKGYSGKLILIVDFVILFILSYGQENEGDTCDANP